MHARLLLLFILLAGYHTAHAQHPPGLSPGDSYHLVFTTSSVHGITPLTFIPPPNFPAFGGLDAADWIVTNAAVTAGLVDSWNGLDLIYTAVLSNSTTNAIDRLGISGPLYTTTGALVATGESDFFDGSLLQAISFDEFGNSVSGNVWTGTNNVGLMTTNTCGLNWNDNGGNIFGTIGDASLTNVPFSGAGSQACNQTARLYGISPLITIPQPEDLNGDGFVDGLDLGILLANWNQSTTPDMGELNGSPPVDGLDLGILLAAWNPPPAAVVVPEPSGLMLALAGLCFGLARTRR